MGGFASWRRVQALEGVYARGRESTMAIVRIVDEDRTLRQPVNIAACLASIGIALGKVGLSFTQ
jgi:hypothetical protein